MAGLSEAIKRELRMIATPKNAKSYRAWLSALPETGADAKRQTAAAEESRQRVGYGRAGEALGRSSYANDGYAAYLREAAKSQRKAKAAAIEDERVKASRKVLEGYGDYLRERKEANATAMETAAKELLALDMGEDTRAEAIIAAADPTSRQAAALRRIYRNNPTAGAESNERVYQFLVKNFYTYQRAYDYCRLIGMNDTNARRMAKAADAALDASHKQLDSLFDD